MVQQDIFFLPFGFRFGGVHPPRIHADTEQAFIHLVPVKLSRVGIGRIVDGHREAWYGGFAYLNLSMNHPCLSM